MTLYRREREVSLDRPVMVFGMEGWIDAGLGAGAATASVLGTIETEILATFDADVLLDHRARRPTLRIVDGVNEGLTWPEIHLRHGTDSGGRDVLVLVGPEPDHEWRAFTNDVVGLAVELGVRLAVGLGAFPAPVPHTRPMRLVSTATSAELAAKVGFVPGIIDVPAGIHAALEQGFATAQIPAVGLWARVPHYAAAMPYPAASAALVDGLASLAGLSLDANELHAAARVTRERIDQLVAQSEEHRVMVEGLETSADADPGDNPLTFDNLPTGDEIAAQFERFLRGDSQG